MYQLGLKLHTKYPGLLVWYCKVRINRFEIDEPVKDGSGFFGKSYLYKSYKPLVCLPDIDLF